MPRGLSPVGLRSPMYAAYAAPVLQGFNPWPDDSCAKRARLHGDGPMLPCVVEVPLEPAAKRQCVAADVQQSLLQLPVTSEKMHARFQHHPAQMLDAKRRRLETCEAGVKIEELEEESQELALIPAEASARSNTQRSTSFFGLSSDCPASIFSCIRNAFSQPSWEPSLHPSHSLHRPWVLDNEDGLELSNLIIFKEGARNVEEMCLLWSVPMSSEALRLEAEAKEPSLPGLVIFDEKIKRPTRQDHDDASSSPRLEVNEEVMMEDGALSIQEVEEVPMEACEVDSDLFY